MTSQICIFEDIHHSKLFPLVYFRPTFNLRCGILSLREKITHAYPKTDIVLHTRSYLADYMRLRNPSFSVNEVKGTGCLFINGRAIVDSEFVKKIPVKGDEDVVYINDDNVIAARVGGSTLKALKKHLHGNFSLSDFDGLKRETIDVKMVRYPWDLIKYNGDQLRNDFTVLKNNRKGLSSKIKKYPGVHVLNEKNVFIDQGTEIKPGVVIDAGDGPVYIGKNVTILPFSVIMGPAYIGDGSVIKSGAKIYHNTSIGPVCKIGGEIEETIVHSYSNKQHDGFLGHSYLGAWVNCGAGTVTSDLKNNYGSVKVYINGEPVDSGTQFVGVTIGDHSKTAINSTFNTGTVIGVSSNIFGTGFPPKYVPSFSWGAAGETFTTYNADKAIDVARKVMARRNIALTVFEEKLFRKIFDLTSEERHKRGMPL
jgi:UDP-N-acetylglucosamine diphosphorylase / glucose-1-phosphate thymidylyltransferase / UDP-N-acetylgalactosamine diphosphorylase / glucosamine-1-phosphate N-acetyltransferase / galactosamine-1-phosphate N-acetyltransferase